MTPPTYRRRLRLEGLVLAGCGALGSVVLLVLVDESRRQPLNTAGQLVLFAGLLTYFGTRATGRALEAAKALPPAALGTGEPTPVWQLPLIVAGLAAPLGVLAGWDAGLRITGGCVVVGLFQALVLERRVARAQAAHGHPFHRIAGSRLGRGTNLGYPDGPPTGSADRG